MTATTTPMGQPTSAPTTGAPSTPGTQVLYFSDQSVALEGPLKQLFKHARTNTSLQNFLDRACALLRHEVAQLPRLDRDAIPDFSSLPMMWEKGAGHTAVNGALLAVLQIGGVISYRDANPDAPLSPATPVFGFCTGLLAGAAVAAASHTVASLVPAGLEMVLVAFRVGVEAQRRANALEPQAEPFGTEARALQSWSTIVPVAGGDAPAIAAKVEAFAAEKALGAKNPYVSYSGPTTLTISGPPQATRALFATALAGTRTFPLPIFAPYHAAALPAPPAFALPAHVADLKLNAPLFSTSTGEVYAGRTLAEVLPLIVDDILARPIDADLLFRSLKTSLDSKDVEVLPFGPIHSPAAVMAGFAGNNVKVQDTGLKEGAQQNRVRDNRIAIVGMGGRFPGAPTLEKLWQNLEDGLDLHRKVPADRFNVDTHFDATGAKPNTSLTPYGCFIEQPGLFDSTMFSMSPREAAQTDPMQRLALTTCYEALETAGYVPNRTPALNTHRIGTFFGQASDDWREVNSSQNIDTYFITGGIRAFVPGRLNYFYKWEGPSYNVDTACSSSLAATQIAVTSLLQGDCDTAVAGGVNVMTTPDVFAGLSRGFFLSKTGGCKTFDDGADGYCRADAIGTIILKRYDDAVRDRDNVLAVILGAATNQSAEAVSITHPHAETQERLYKGMLERAGVDGKEIDYVEMHGTGTQAGDANEMKSVINTFTSGRQVATRPVYVGAVKANMGHAEAASGVTAIIKCLLMLRNNAIPPHVGIKKKLNHIFPPLDPLGIKINTTGKSVPWPRPADRPRRIVVNNFSAAGGNTTLLMEDAPPLIVEGEDPRASHVVALSAKTATSLMHNAERLLTFLSTHPETKVADLSYTTTARRVHHGFRKSMVGASIADIKSQLESFLATGTKPTRTPQPPVAFAFTGQGSHYTGMGARLFGTVPSFRADIQHMDAIATGHGFPSFISIITGEDAPTAPGPVQTQLALCSLEMALAKLWLSYGVKPTVLLGHSLGEYAALHTAGVLSLSDTLFLVGSRAQIMESTCTPGTHAMLATKMSAAQITDAIAPVRGSCELSCLNSLTETVVSGPDEEISAIAAHLEKAGVRATKLNVPFAFHSAQVEAILPQFREVAKKAVFHAPRIAVASSSLGELVEAGKTDVFDANYLADHARNPVKFIPAVEAATTLLGAQPAGHASVWVEVGPHPVCVRMVKAATTLGSLLKKSDDWAAMTATLGAMYQAGVNLDWSEVSRPFEKALRLLLLPTYAFDEKNYWIQYTGDWALSKNRLPAPTTVVKEEPKEDVPISTFSTTSLHKVIRQDFAKGEVVFVSNLQEAKLKASIAGHMVHGNALTPSSLYADMALTAASYMFTSTHADTTVPGLGCGKMEVFAPLMLKDDVQAQELQITANGNVDDGYITVKFTALNPKKEHAVCEVRFGDADAWKAEWAAVAYLVDSRMAAMAKAADEDAGVDRFQRKMAYRLFTSMVHYAPQYQGLQTVLLDSHGLEASARVKFQYTEKDGEFLYSPYAIDSIGHLSGFVVNTAGDEDNAYISHGWDNLRVTKPFETGKEYRTYVRMRSYGGKVVGGDVYCFEGDEVIAVFGGLKFMEMSKRILERLLPHKGAAAGAKKPAPAALKAAPAAPAKKAAAAPASAPKKAAPAPAAAPAAPAGGNELAKIFDVLIEEVGCQASDLQDSTTFEEIGVDSLLSLSILGRLRDQMTHIDFPANLFLDEPTIGDLKKFIARVAPAPAAAPAAAAPAPADHVSEDSSDESDGSSTPSASSAATTEPPSRSDEVVELFREVISAEVGVEPSDLTPDSDLAELGVDSLMSLSILGVLREKTDIDLPGSFFQDHATFGDIMAYLAPTPALAKPSAPAPAPTTSKPKAAPKNLSVLLQGRPQPGKPALFLLPDGSGSAAVYANIPPTNTGLAIYGLNSPHLHQPAGSFHATVEDLAATWVAEIRKRQPTGPYLLGGWSFGGMAAYEVAYQLVQAGEVVQGVVLIDSPSPIALPPLPVAMVKFIAGTGLFGDVSKGIPEWLITHFDAAIKALLEYEPKRLPAAQRPKTIAIWATDGVCGKKAVGMAKPQLAPEDRNGTVDWLLNDRTEFGSNGWEGLLDVTGSLTTSGNHFSMMKAGQIEELGEQIVAAWKQLA